VRESVTKLADYIGSSIIENNLTFGNIYGIIVMLGGKRKKEFGGGQI
tara:strand:+ start:630 stop:770 length:141 start_codon:yes stop_codon:yes gene_type:complete